MCTQVSCSPLHKAKPVCMHVYVLCMCLSDSMWVCGSWVLHVFPRLRLGSCVVLWAGLFENPSEVNDPEAGLCVCLNLHVCVFVFVCVFVCMYFYAKRSEGAQGRGVLGARVLC